MNTTAVVLLWNDAGRVVDLLAALGALDPPPERVVIVDNGSTGNDAERVAASFPGHELVRLAANAGFAAAANRGIERALAQGAEWVWLLNTDLVLPSDALARLRNAAADPRCGMAAAVLTEADGRVQARGGGRVSLWTGSSAHAVSDTEECDYLSAACLLVRGAMLRDIGLFDEGYFFYWEDVDLGFRAREAGWGLAVATECRVVHHEGSTLGRWSAERWELLFVGMIRFLVARAPLPRLAVMARLAVHTLTMLRHGRVDAVRGAWRALGAGG